MDGGINTQPSEDEIDVDDLAVTRATTITTTSTTETGGGGQTTMRNSGRGHDDLLGNRQVPPRNTSFDTTDGSSETEKESVSGNLTPSVDKASDAAASNNKPSGDLSSTESGGYTSSGTSRTTRMDSNGTSPLEAAEQDGYSNTYRRADFSSRRAGGLDDLKGSSHHRSKRISRSSFMDQVEEPDATGMMYHAQKIRQKWAEITKRGRGVLLHGVVVISKKAAQYPVITLCICFSVAFGLIIGGVLTNFNVRLDNDKIFTPTNSEVAEHAEYMDDTMMYEGQETSRRLQIVTSKGRIYEPLPGFSYRGLQRLKRQRHKLRNLLTISIFDDEDMDLFLPSAEDNSTSSSEVVVTSSIETPMETTAPSVVEVDPIHIELGEVNFTPEAGTGPTSSPTFVEEGTQQGDSESDSLDDTIPPTPAPTEEPKVYARGQGSIFSLLMHADTANVFSLEGMERQWDVLDHLRNSKYYVDSCTGDENSFHDAYGENTCEIRSITRFWQHNRTVYNEQIKTEEDLFDAVDEVNYPDGGFVDLPFILAEMEEDEFGRPVEAQAFYSWVYLKSRDYEFELAAHMGELHEKWEDEETMYEVSYASPGGFEKEVQRAIMGDVPLIPTVFVVMSLFTCLVFFKCDRVQSRSMLGIGAVVTVFMSVMSGYGILFMCGVPMTMMTNLLLFVIMGIGLDDTFIITGAYFRTGNIKDPVARIERTMEAVGSSILLTTITTTTAFLLGATSSVLPIRWLCLYAFPTVVIDFLFQITLFIAILVLDERRLQANKMDCCVCVQVPKPPPRDDGLDESGRSMTFTKESRQQSSMRPKNSGSYESDHVADRFMRWFASRLMNPVIKILVLVIFISFSGICIWRTTKLRQEFNFNDMLPKDSYLASYVKDVEYYSDRAIAMRVVFRFVDQSDDEIRAQMISYVEQLVEEVDALNEPPPLFWARDFEKVLAADEHLASKPFYNALGLILSDPRAKDLFGKDIRFRHDGTIMMSLCTMYVTDLDMNNVLEQIKFLQQQRAVTERQSVNVGRNLWCFFSYDLLFHIFAFYEVAAGELTITTIMSVSSVCIISFLLIPHWTAVPIILPIICILYIQMMGVIEMFGYSINVITYIVLVISIGLLVDFIMHILLRYYESECDTREEKVKDALGTMGASILVGGLSTFLGVTPLIFSASEIFSTVCLAFLALVFLGVTHGLIVLPVILSYVGTETVVRHRKRLSLIQISRALSGRLIATMEDASLRRMAEEDSSSSSSDSDSD